MKRDEREEIGSSHWGRRRDAVWGEEAEEAEARDGDEKEVVERSKEEEKGAVASRSEGRGLKQKKERRKKGLGLVQSAPFGEEEEDPAGAPSTRPDPTRRPGPSVAESVGNDPFTPNSFKYLHVPV